MLLRTILGRAGTGKTTLCLQEIVAKQASEGKHALLYIVPEQFSLQSERALLKAADNRALMRAETLSFQRLSFRVFTEIGGFNKVVLEDVGRNIILRKILLDIKPQLLYFTGSVDKQGFIDKLSAMLAELYQYEIRPESLQYASGQVIGDEGLRLKLHDLSIILAAYGSYLTEHQFSGDDTLDLLAERMGESAFVKNAEIWIDGFTSFTPQEYRVLDGLLRHAASVTVALTVDNVQAGYPELNRQDAFFETKSTMNALYQLAQNASASVVAPIALDRTIRSVPALAFLEKAYMGYQPAKFGGDASCVRLVQADNMYAEIHAAARTVVALTREKQIRHNEIGIICASHEAYAKSVQAVFAQYDIPVFIDAKEDMLSHPLVEYIRSAFEIITGGWQYENVFRFLKTGITNITREDIDKLENYVLAYGIRYNRWQKEWMYGFDGQYERFDREEINGLRERVLALLSPLTTRFTRSGRYTAADFCRALYALLDENGAGIVLEQWIDEARASGQNLLWQMHTQAWENVIDLIDKVFETLGDEQMTVLDFARVLEAGISAVSLGLVPPSLDQVIVGDLRRSRLPQVKALLLLGANENALPGQMKADGVLSDDERRVLSGKGLQLAPDGLSRALADNLSVYGVLTKPSEFLYISCYLSELDGKAVFPSPVMHRIEELLPYADKRCTDTEAAIERISTASVTFDGLARAVRGYAETGEISDVYQDVYTFFRGNQPYDHMLAQIESQIAAEGTPERLMRETVFRLYAGRVMTSVTQLERYAQCPFSYFMRYNLRALERKVYEVESVQVGTLFHSALELYAKRLAEEGIDWNDPDDETLVALMEACVDAALAAQGNEILRSTGQYRHFTERIKGIAVQSIRALTEHMRGSGFAVAALETAFGGKDAEAVCVPLANGEMELQGRVDRVDLLTIDDTAYVKLVDYKSGHKAFSLSEVYYGLQLQLVMYIDAVIGQMKARAGLAKVHPAALLYFRLQNPVVEFDAAMSEEQMRVRLLSEFKMTGLVLDDQQVLSNLDVRLQAGLEESVQSAVVPVALNKAKKDDDFLLSKRSKVVSAEAFGKLMSFVMKKAEMLGNSILDGDISVWPCLHKKASGCQYCTYQAVCRFEPGRNAHHVMPFLKDTDAQARVLGIHGHK